MHAERNEIMTKPLPVKEKDIVEILPGCPFASLVHSKGIVRSSLGLMSCIVEFPTERRSQDFETMEVLQSKFWCIPWKYLKIIESAYDDTLGMMEHQVLDLEESLMFTRSCLSISEELRDQQADLIERLVEEVDMLKARLYYFGDNTN